MNEIQRIFSVSVKKGELNKKRQLPLHKVKYTF